MTLLPYLFFKSDCEDALAFYEACGLCQGTVLLRYEEAHAASFRQSLIVGKIMHAEFKGTGVLFYASDNADAEPMKGFALNINLTDLAQATLLFASLSEGGQITRPLSKQFWGAYFGMLVDRFGVPWMLNCEDT